MPNATTSPERARLTARVPVDVRDILETAAAMCGATLNQFLIRSALREAERLIEQERVIRLSARDTERFFQALENPAPPNAKLKATLQRYKEAGADARDATFDWRPRPKRIRLRHSRP